jgi:hypothetical protein
MKENIKVYKVTTYYKGEPEPMIVYYTNLKDVLEATSIAEAEGASQIIVEEDKSN